jgi:glycerol uptake facilitator-like aquaporin
MNPAITLAMMVTDNITYTRAFYYMIAQFAGAFAGAGALNGMTRDVSGLDTPTWNGGIAMTVEADQAFGFEFIGTFLLLLVVFNVAVWSSKPLQNDLSVNALCADVSNTSFVNCSRHGWRSTYQPACAAAVVSTSVSPIICLAGGNRVFNPLLIFHDSLLTLMTSHTDTGRAPAWPLLH